jgi:hypothetical protein
LFSIIIIIIIIIIINRLIELRQKCLKFPRTFSLHAVRNLYPITSNLGGVTYMKVNYIQKLPLPKEKNNYVSRKTPNGSKNYFM